MTTDERLDTIDSRLERLIQGAERQSQLQRESHEQAIAEFEQQRRRNQENHEQAMAKLQKLEQITQQQADTIRQQTDNITRLVGAVSELSRSVTTISRNQFPLLENRRRAVRSSEVTEILGSRILEKLRELRDAVDELRQGRL